MSIAYVQDVLFRSNGNPAIATGTFAATGSGNFLVLGIGVYGDPDQWIAGVQSIIDDAGNTYIQAPGAASDTTDGGGVFAPHVGSDIYYCANCLPGATTLTVTINSPSGNGGITFGSFYEFSGVKTVGAFDSANNFANPYGTGAAPVSPTLTPSVSEELLFTVLVQDANQATGINPPWILDTTNSGFPQSAAYTINAPLSSQQAVYIPTLIGDVASSIASFLAASPPPPPTNNSDMFLTF